MARKLSGRPHSRNPGNKYTAVTIDFSTSSSNHKEFSPRMSPGNKTVGWSLNRQDLPHKPCRLCTQPSQEMVFSGIWTQGPAPAATAAALPGTLGRVGAPAGATWLSPTGLQELGHSGQRARAHQNTQPMRPPALHTSPDKVQREKEARPKGCQSWREKSKHTPHLLSSFDSKALQINA